MTVKEEYAHLCSFLDKTDSRLILSFVLNLTHTGFVLASNDNLTDEQLDKTEELAQKRRNGVPLAYLTGEKEFYGRSFLVEPGVLIPRPETEIIVEQALSFMKSLKPGRPVRILDLCAGSGCIGISLFCESVVAKIPAELWLSDISKTAYDVFCKNVLKMIGLNENVHFVCGNLFDGLGNLTFDIIVTNPPYIASDVIPSLQKEVRNEPVLALDGGEDGLDIIKQIAGGSASHLTEKAGIFMEIGYDQEEEVKKLFHSCGYENVSCIKDLAGLPRVIICLN